MRNFVILALLCASLFMSNAAFATCYLITNSVDETSETICYSDPLPPLVPWNGSGAVAPNGSPGINAVPSSAQQAHIDSCVQAYSGITPPRGWLVVFSIDFGWGRKINGVPQPPVTTTRPIPPNGYTANDLLYGSTDYNQKVSTIYNSSYVSTAQTIAAVAHEEYHENNPTAPESSAIAAGNAAKSAYLNDPHGVGAACGGP